MLKPVASGVKWVSACASLTGTEDRRAVGRTLKNKKNYVNSHPIQQVGRRCTILHIIH